MNNTFGTKSAASSEFFENKTGQLIHVRTGEPVAAFESTGLQRNKLGNVVRGHQIFSPTKQGFMAMQLVDLVNPRRTAVLTNGVRVNLTTGD